MTLFLLCRTEYSYHDDECDHFSVLGVYTERGFAENDRTKDKQINPDCIYDILEVVTNKHYELGAQ
jgi:hypothetical protein